MLNSGSIPKSLTWKKDFQDSNYRRLVSDVSSLAKLHGKWISQDCLNLVSAHNIMSPSARAILSSGLADKILAGRIKNRDHAGATFIDEIDKICISVASRLFKASYVEYRPMSGAIANGIAICSVTKPGTNVITWPKKYGAHFTFQEKGYPFYRNLKVSEIPCDEGDGEGAIDFPKLEEMIDAIRPSTLILGSSTVLFPYPLRRLTKIASRAGVNVMYDGAHVMGLIAGGKFQKPFEEGATVLTGSTQKTMPGPVGGLILSNDKPLADLVQTTTDHLIANYQNNRVAALTIAMIELLAFGRSLADRITKNAKSLARSLSKQGFVVLCKKRDFTESHQLIIDMKESGGAEEAVRQLERANILSTRITIPRDFPDHVDEPSGLRLGTNEISRFDMGSAEMNIIANLIARTLIDKEKPEIIRKEVSMLKDQFSQMKYVLDPESIESFIPK